MESKKKWVVYVDDTNMKALFEDMGILSYVPMWFDEFLFLFVKTDMSKEQLLSIDGVTDVREEMIGSVDV